MEQEKKYFEIFLSFPSCYLRASDIFPYRNACTSRFTAWGVMLHDKHFPERFVQHGLTSEWLMGVCIGAVYK